ncbi:MAG: hypothetical protein V4568_16405 [Pseudomonadota bacterium]
MAPEQLVTGTLYYVVSFADEEMTIPIVATYEYLGPEGSDNGNYVFENIHGQDMLELAERNLDIVLDIQALIEMLSSLPEQE